MAIEDVVFADPMCRVVGLGWVFNKYPRLQLRPILLPNPRQFEFRLLLRHDLFNKKGIHRLEDVLKDVKRLRVKEVNRDSLLS